MKFKHIRMSKKMYGGFVKLKNFGTINPDAYDIIVVDPNLRMLDFIGSTVKVLGQTYRMGTS